MANPKHWAEIGRLIERLMRGRLRERLGSAIAS
jgi:hypothetical protein